MPIGDVISNVASINANEMISMQPDAGIEWVIHNLGHAGAAELYFYDGSNLLLMDQDTAGGSWIGIFLHCTNTKYYQVKNTSGGSALLSYDGVVTKST